MGARISVDAVGTALFAALGWVGGCGGAVVDNGAVDGGAGSMSVEQATKCAAHRCSNPKPILVAGVDTGFDTCAGGAVRRRAVVECPSLLPRTVACVGPGQCATDADCRGPLGYCGVVQVPGQSCACKSGCRRDADCPNGEMCFCGDPVGTCVSSTCASAQDCQPGCDCVSPDQETFQCQTPADACLSSGDCLNAPPSGTVLGGCTYLPSTCSGKDLSTGMIGTALTCRAQMSCRMGRPFLVRGEERLATAVVEAAWAHRSIAPRVDGPADVLDAAAVRWMRVGLMEHASIAAFARFTLQLLALGAPPDLVGEAQRAMMDETEHARLAFALASAFAGERVGPGPLAIDGALDGLDVRAFVATLIREGCVGETTAAIEARDALADVEDQVVREVLETIARDELRHAVLAWRALEWVVASGRVSRAAVAAEVRAAIDETTPSPAATRGGARPTDDAWLRRYGLVDEARRREIRRLALGRVIGPRARALLATPMPVLPTS